MADQYDIQIAQLKSEQDRLRVYRDRLVLEEQQQTEGMLDVGRQDISSAISQLAMAGLVIPGMVSQTQLVASKTGQSATVDTVSDAYSLTSLLDFTQSNIQENINRMQAEYETQFTDIDTQLGNLSTQTSKTKQAQQSAQQAEFWGNMAEIGTGLGVAIASGVTGNVYGVFAGAGMVVKGILDILI